MTAQVLIVDDTAFMRRMLVNQVQSIRPFGHKIRRPDLTDGSQ